MAEQTFIEPIEVDINDASLAEGEVHDIDVKEDWQARACPPPKGRYVLKLFAGDAKFEQGTKQGFPAGDVKGAYYKKAIICKIQNEGKWQNSVLDYRSSTGIPRGKKMSTMAGLMSLGGVKLKPQMSDLSIARTFMKWLATEPVLPADCDWDCWDSGDKDNMKRLLMGMDKFPKNAKGEPLHIIRNNKGEEFVAKLKVMKWYAKGAPTAAVKTQAAAAPAKVAPKPQEVVEVVDAGEVGEISFDDSGEIVLE